MSSSEEEGQFDEESEEDMPLAGLKKGKENGEVNGKRRRSTSKTISYAEDDDDEEEEEEEEFGDDDDDDDDDDSDEDVPLAALKSAATPKKKVANGKKKASPAAKKKKTATITASKSSSSSSSSSDNYQSPSAALYGSDCQKGQLIQKLLCRWWYAITWPDPAKIPAKPPKHYDSLDGIPGVYVCTSGDDVGQIKDFRDKETCPNFANLAKKSADELQTLLIKAIEEQKRALVELEGPGTSTEKELNNQLKWAKKIKPTTADREAVKVLKAAKMSLT